MPASVPRSDLPPATSGPLGELRIADRLQIEVHLLGSVLLGDYWTYDDLCAPDWRLYLNLADGASLVIAGKPWPLRAGRPLLIPPWLHFATRPGRGVRHAYVVFSAPRLPDDLVRRLFPLPLDLHPAPEVEAPLRGLQAVLADGAPPTPSCLFAAKGAAFLALGRAIATLGAASGALLLERLAEVGPVQALAAAIDADPGGAWSVAGMARSLGCSPEHVNRLFRRHQGMGPQRFIAERRMAAAARALIASRDAIGDIAERYGFASRFSFTRCFTRRFGAGPAAYRRRAWGGRPGVAG